MTSPFSGCLFAIRSFYKTIIDYCKEEILLARALPIAAILIAQTAAAAPKDMTVFRLLSVIGHLQQSEEANNELGAYLSTIIRAELALDAPAFCPSDGQGTVDAIALRDFAIEQAPTTAAQSRMDAQPVVIGYLAAEYPCR